MVALLNWRIWAAVTIAVFLAGTHWKAYKAGANGVQARWDSEKLELVTQAQKVKDAATATTERLQADTDKLRRTKNAQIAKLDAALADALTSLSHRPNRPDDGSVPTPSGTGSSAGCTGASLYRADASFLTVEAARADRLLAQLGQCQDAYNNARETLRSPP